MLVEVHILAFKRKPEELTSQVEAHTFTLYPNSYRKGLLVGFAYFVLLISLSCGLTCVPDLC